MKNFTVGPVQEPEYVLRIGAEPTPYFRNASFSNIMLENEQMIKEIICAPADAKAVFLTASGTGAMEAAVLNVFTPQDQVLIVNGGSFGERFVQICRIHGIPYQEIIVPFDEDLTAELLAPYDTRGFTGFLINMNETSIGKLYNMQLVAEFCKRNHLFLVVDAISSFLADPFNMQQLCVDVMITGSQKALAVPPGISILVLSDQAVKRVKNHKIQSFYFDLSNALANMERGQTPFTPAVSILLQIHARLKEITKAGIEQEIGKIAKLADHFRKGINALPLKIAVGSLSNAVTPIMIECMSAYELFERLESDYQIWICPNGGKFRDTLFRVGHLGNLTKEDNDRLIKALKEILCDNIKKC